MQEQYDSTFTNQLPPDLPVPHTLDSRPEYLGRIYRFKFHGEAM